MIAEKGDELFDLSRKNKTYIGYEAAVAGAIPIINSLMHNMRNEEISSISGIINGTCNYILEQMSSEGKSFEESLKALKSLATLKLIQHLTLEASTQLTRSLFFQ